MPRKVSREERQNTRKILSRPKKIIPPQKRKQDDVEYNSTSFNKIKLNTCSEVEEDVGKQYKIIDFILVFSTIATLAKCIECDGNLTFQSCKKEGLGFVIKVICKKCKPRYVPSSKRIESGMYEVNYRFTFVMRVLGLGLAGCNKFCGLMDLASNFLSKPTYNRYVEEMGTTINVANKFFASAVKEEKEATCKTNNVNETSELTVSGDGTWKKRGFSSLYGVSSLIGFYTGKVVDIFVKSSYCHDCKTWQSRLDSAEFEEWHEGHVNSGQCKANHVGPAGNMEVDSIIQMFQRSLKNFGVKFRNYIGDGDSKTYSGIVNAKPYGDNFTINKKECVGHVQKRMGTRLRELVKNTVVDAETKTGKKIRKKSLGDKGKLTAKMIDKLTVYYGLAIRRNHDCVKKMKNAKWSTYFHYCSTDEKLQHNKCPSGDDSWCEWQKAAATTSRKSFKHSYTPLPNDVAEAIKPIYEDLSKDALLQRCLGGFTQNNNESLNQLIWKISPKSVSGTSIIVEIAAYVAACTFNEGCFALLTFMQDMQIAMGSNSHKWARTEDINRISRAEQQAAHDSIDSRILRRKNQKDALDMGADIAALYGPGIADLLS